MRTILVVDDEPEVRAMLRRALPLLLPCRVLEAEDGLAALAVIRDTPPDLVLLDIAMPRLDGWGVLRALQAEPATRTLPVVVISGHSFVSKTPDLDVGPVRLLPKPFRLTALRAVVNEVLGTPAG